MRIILASNSPRRRELLEQMGVEFEVIPSQFDEQLDNNRSTEAVARELALGKAQEVANRYPDALVIGSDTIVALDGKQLAKPADAEEALEMLVSLSGRTHAVTTGLALVQVATGFVYSGSDTSYVTFKPANGLAIKQYISTGDPYDKAGSYGIQSGAAPLIAHYEGNYDTIVGLPTKMLQIKLAELGIESRSVDLFAPVPRKLSQ